MRGTDTCRVFRLFADVAALRAEPVVQRQELIDGISRLLGTNCGWLFAFEDFRPGLAPRMQAQLLVSDPDPVWLKYITQWVVHLPIDNDPYAAAVLNSPKRFQLWTHDAIVQAVQTDPRFAQSARAMKELQLNDGLLAAARFGPGLNHVVGFSLHCARSSRRLDQRGRDIARLAVREIERLRMTGTIRLSPPAPEDLPPRLQQIFGRLLDGRSAKQIALDLNLSVHTVREHIQRLYGHHQVTSREELMAQHVRAAGESNGLLDRAHQGNS
jgi:DNA-binding CsgD family transcriptional regulator